MNSGSLSNRIDHLKKRLAYRCHRFVVEGRATKNRIAKEAGLSWTLVKDIGSPEFDPSFKTLKALDQIIPGDWEPSTKFVEYDDISKLDLTKFQLGRGRIIGELSRNSKVLMDANAVQAVDPVQIARAQQFLEQRRGRDGVIREDPYFLDVLKGVAPQCSTHVIDIEDPDPMNFYFIRWDTATGYRNSLDLSGTNLAYVDDPAMRECVVQDYLVVRETGWPHFSAVERRFHHGETRSYLRLMVPFRGANSRSRMLSITRPRAFNT